MLPSAELIRPLAKSMSAYAEGSGGALVAPPAQGLAGRRKCLKCGKAIARAGAGWRCTDPDCNWSLFQGGDVDAHSPKDLRLRYRDKGIFASIETAAAYLADKWSLLEERYGRRAALAMAVAMVATGPLPGSIPAIVAAAEAIRGVHGYFSRASSSYFATCPRDEGGHCKQKTLSTFRHARKSYFATCPRDRTGHCKPKDEADESGQGTEEGTGQQSQENPQPKTAKIRPGFHGIQRQKDGTYTDTGGKPLPEEIHNRLKGMRLPPAWTGVQVAGSAGADLQAVGYDAKGREQRVYSASHWEKADREKFLRNKALVQELPQLEESIRKTLAGPDGPDKEAAAVLLLMRKMGFRIGSETDTKTEHEALGATTLTAANVTVDGDTVRFDFIGKKGVRIQQETKDAELAGLLSPRLGRSSKLFDTSDVKVRDYLHSIDGVFKPKDFRTLVAAETALKAMQDLPHPKDDKAFKKQRLTVAKIVSAKLGNTPTVALQSYIPPEVFIPWQSPTT